MATVAKTGRDRGRIMFNKKKQYKANVEREEKIHRIFELEEILGIDVNLRKLVEHHSDVMINALLKKREEQLLEFEQEQEEDNINEN